MYCKNCGKEIAAGTNYCPFCGASQGNMVAAAGGRSKIVAGILGILVGEFGVHRFYLGYIGIGIIQIIVTIVTFGVGGLWGFIEGILLLVGTFDRDADGKPLTG